MSNQPDHQQELIQRFREIRGGLKNVEIALWANNFVLAHGFLSQLEQNQKDFLERIANLREKLLDIRKSIEESSSRTLSGSTGAKKWQNEFMKEYVIEEKQLEIIDDQQLEHELIPLQYQIQRYRRKINEALGVHTDLPQIIPDNLDEYRSVLVGSSDGQVKYRVYRFVGQFNLQPRQFIESIDRELEATSQIIPEQELSPEWQQVFPLWLRVFSGRFFIEFTVFDQNRVEIIITARTDELSMELVAKLMAVLKAA